MRLNVVSDGTATGTRVVNAETGEELDYVTRVELISDAKEGWTRATIYVSNVGCSCACACKDPSENGLPSRPSSQS